MLERSYLEGVMEKVILRMTRPQKVDMVEDFPISNLDFTKWEWPQGVGNYGMLKLYQMTGEERWLSLLCDWFERRIAEGLPPKNVNTMAPMLSLIHLHEITGRKDWLGLCLEWAEWVVKEMPRTPDGGLQHITIASANEGELWVDTLFMTVLFLAKTGRLTGRSEYVEEALRQFLVHVKYLADRKTGLFFHGWTFKGMHNFAEAHWGRGNCWFTAGVLDFLEMAGIQGGARAFLLDTFRDQVEALLPLQDREGMWHTLVDEPSSYAESSATAGFGYGILKGVRLGILPASCRESGLRACEAVLARIDPTGSVTGVSYGTPMGHELDFYRKIAVCPTAYGQSLTVLMLGEALRAADAAAVGAKA